MEFPFNVNSVIRGNICVVDQTLVPKYISASDPDHVKIEGVPNKLTDALSNFSRFHSLESKNAHHLSSIINAMGEASAHAQKLPVAITTEQKLRDSENRLYIIKDEDANSGQGAVVGILKVGSKHLFVLDREGQHHECSPLCVLDFYVHESRQRKGYGHTLFQYMLKEEGVAPHHMAVDRPSEKLLTFLQKFYLLSKPIQQPNNFVLFDGFFHNNSAHQTMTEATASYLQQVNKDEFQTPTNKNSTPNEDCISVRNSSWWKVLGITPRNFDHSTLSTPTGKQDRVQRRLW